MTHRLTAPLAFAAALFVAAPLVAQHPLELKLLELRDRYEHGSPHSKDYRIEEKEANEFLKAERAAVEAEGIESPWVRFEDSFAVLGATLDLEKVRDKLPDSMVFRLLTGRVPVEVTARFRGERGVGLVELEQVLLGGVHLPLSVIEMLVSDVENIPYLPEGFRLGEPFRLPYNVERVWLRSGAVTLRQRPTVLDK